MIEAIETGLPAAAKLNEPSGNAIELRGHQCQAMRSAYDRPFYQPGFFQHRHVTTQSLFGESKLLRDVRRASTAARQAHENCTAMFIRQRIYDLAKLRLFASHGAIIRCDAPKVNNVVYRLATEAWGMHLTLAKS